MKRLITTLIIVLFTGILFIDRANASPSFTSPTQSSTVHGMITVTATGIANGDYAKFYLPNAPVGTTCPVAGEVYDNAWNGGGNPFGSATGGCALYVGAPYSFTFDTTQVPNGASGFAVQDEGAGTLAQVTVTVSNGSGSCTVAISQPPASAHVTNPFPVTLTETNCGGQFSQISATRRGFSQNFNFTGPSTMITLPAPNTYTLVGSAWSDSTYTTKIGTSTSEGITVTGSAPTPTPTTTPTPPVPTPTPTPSPTPTPTKTPTPTPTPTGAPQIVSVNDMRNVWGIDTKMIQDHTSTSNTKIEYANAIAYGGWRWIRDDATHANSGAQDDLIYAVTQASSFEGAPVFVDELPVVDDNSSGTGCTVSPTNPFCGVVKDTQYEWDYLANAGVLGPILEAMNEPNNFGFQYLTGTCGNFNNGGNNSYNACVAAAADIYTMEKADPLLNRPLVGMSEPGGEPNAAGAPNEVGTIFDLFNFHNYWTTATIGVGQLRIDNQVFNAFSMFPSATGQDTWGNYEGDTQNNFFTWSGKEAITVHDSTVGQFGGPGNVTTECGFNVYQCQNSGGDCTSRYTQGIAAIEGYLDGVLQGFQHVAQYEMFERNPNDGGWGFFLPNAAVDNISFNPSVMSNESTCCTDQATPSSGEFMHNMTSVLNDTVSVPSGSLVIPSGYSVSGGAATTHSLLGQYSASGQFPNKHVAIVWDEAFSGAQTNVTVNLGSTVSTVTVYGMFNGAGNPITTYSNVSTVPLTVSGELSPFFVVF